MHITRIRVAAIAAALALVAGACSDGVGVADRAQAGEPAVETTSGGDASAGFAVRPSVHQVTVANAEPGAPLTLRNSAGDEVSSAEADSEGNHIFRLVDEGSGYWVESEGTESQLFDIGTAETSRPDQDFYSGQELDDGYHYIETRDGTTLAAAVYVPPGDGPFPTVVEYSGYDPADPTQDLREAAEGLGVDPDEICLTVTVICRRPAQPSSLVMAAMGYAVVSVNMRGTGCSGGAYDFFEELQVTDGYDVIETVAAQPWVRNNKVGMVGLSYPGISQLWVAASNPPSLAAIAPLSIFDDTIRGVLAPGGIFNEGFAFSWAEQVLDDAEPYGQGWEQTLVDQGDDVCAENQKLRSQNVDAVAKAQVYRYYAPEVSDPLNPAMFVDRITVPVFTTGAWQDEQTGPRFVNLWDKFTNSPLFRAIGFNGAHADGYSPETLTELKLFLDITVARERTPINEAVRLLVPEMMKEVFKTSVSIPEERLLEGSIDEITAAYEREPQITILWDRGANADSPGAPRAEGSTTFDSWPPKQGATSWYLGPDGTLSDSPPRTNGGASDAILDPALAKKVTLPGDKQGQAFHALPEWEWDQDVEGNAAVFVSPPLTRDTVMIGGGSADLWIRSDVGNVDVGVTLSEVRPDDKETYVQSGVLRTEDRKPGPDATALDPRPTGLESDALGLDPGEWAEARVSILPAAHVFRKGSRIRLSVHTPGGDKPRWSWILDDFDRVPTLTVGHDAEHPSKIVLPIVADVSGYPSALPPCPSLRGQPCRPFVDYTNNPASG